MADQAAVTKRADRFLGLHFFNPAQVMPLLEVVRADGTGEEAVKLGFELGHGTKIRPGETRRSCDSEDGS